MRQSFGYFLERLFAAELPADDEFVDRLRSLVSDDAFQV